MRIRFVSLIFGTVFSFLATPSLSAEKKEDEPRRIEFSMAALTAAEIAMTQFVKDQPKADAKNFHVIIGESPTSFMVDFVPNLMPIKEWIDGDTAYIAVPSGSGNEYGRNIRYEVSKSSGEIVKRIYPR
jgi:hypothetical protein